MQHSSKTIFLLIFMVSQFHMKAQDKQTGYYAMANGLTMYYETYGSGSPLVLIHGGGSTIQSSFGRILPQLAKTHKIIAVELQAHGRTKDIDRPLSFEQDADDVAALLHHLKITKADVLGFSNGGTTALQIAIRHPDAVGKLVLCSTAYRRDGMMPGFFEGMAQVTFDQMPQPLKTAFLEVNPDPKGLQAMFDRDVARMRGFKDIPDAAIKGIKAPALVINGYADVILPEHALALAHLLPNSQLAILPCGHGDYIGEICAADKNSRLTESVAVMIEEFLAGK
jgi:pimeloyl-ACP methyl ester carboxylesterase